MNITLANRRVTVILTPTDMRCGIPGITQIAVAAGIDITQGKDLVVVVAGNRKMCKILTADEKGILLITRRIYRGTFEQLLGPKEGRALRKITKRELEQFLNGERIQTKRSNFYHG